MIKRLIFALFSCVIFLSCDTKQDMIDEDPGWNNSGSADELIVMSYNIRHCAPYYGTSETTEADVNNIAAVVKRLKPDVVFLQEVDKNTKRSKGVDQAAELAKLAGYPFYYFFKSMDYQDGEYGIAILSGIQLTEVTAHSLPKEYPDGSVSGDFVIGTGKIRVGSRTILLVNAHLSVNQSDRDKQMPYVLQQIIGSEQEDVIFAGDFNAIPANNTILQLTQAGFFRTNTNAGNFTIPSNLPNREIDYISYKPKNSFEVINHLVHTGIDASDHLPITSKMKIKK